MSAVTVNGSSTRMGLRMLAEGVAQAAILTLRSAEAAAVASAKGSTLFRDKSGGTRASIRSVGRGFVGFVEARGAAQFLEGGTRPHTIVGRPVLRFTVNGQVFYRRWVRHPGTHERPFMHVARQAAEQAANYGADYFVNFAISRAH